MCTINANIPEDYMVFCIIHTQMYYTNTTIFIIFHLISLIQFLLQLQLLSFVYTSILGVCFLSRSRKC